MDKFYSKINFSLKMRNVILHLPPWKDWPFPYSETKECCWANQNVRHRPRTGGGRSEEIQPWNKKRANCTQRDGEFTKTMREVWHLIYIYLHCNNQVRGRAVCIVPPTLGVRVSNSLLKHNSTPWFHELDFSAMSSQCHRLVSTVKFIHGSNSVI
jgi:hypothetical protein